jgi:hypothetical protein
MKTLLNVPNPSPDWQGLAHVISRSAGLRDDVTLVVDPDGLRFLDDDCHEIRAETPAGKWTEDSICQLAMKLSFLDWLYERFPTPPHVATNDIPVGPRPASYFNGDSSSDNRLAAIQSTF